MKVKELLDEMWFGSEDPTKRHPVVTYNLRDPSVQRANWAVFAGKKQLASGKTKDEAQAMVNSVTLQKKFGKITAQQMK